MKLSVKKRGGSNHFGSSRQISHTVSKSPKEVPKFTTLVDTTTLSDYSVEKGTCIICGLSSKRTIPDTPGQYRYHSCLADICLPCLQRILSLQYSNGITNFFCPICFKDITLADLSVLHPTLSTIINDALTKEVLNQDSIECHFCSSRFYFEPGTIDSVPLTMNNRQLTKDQRLCQAKYNMCCPDCGISSCTHCHSVPYHVGETCEEHSWFVKGFVCRFCGRPVNPLSAPNGRLSLLVCDSPSCQNRSKTACDHIHPCGHACCGLIGETRHPPCPECSDTNALCRHCHQPLWGEECLLLSCGHSIHSKCAMTIIRRSREGPALELPLCPASGCGHFVSHPMLAENEKTASALREWEEIEPLVDFAAKWRIAAEGIEYIAEVKSKSSPYSVWGDDAALNWTKKNMQFMLCRNSTHKTIVYIECRKVDWNPGNYSLCPLCCSNYPKPVCPDHGHWAMAYKCEKCCSVAVRRLQIDKNSEKWLCELCTSMPNSQSSVCKGNCRFSPHTCGNDIVYGRCAKCGKIFSKAISYR